MGRRLKAITEQHRRDVLAKRRASGLSQAAFCLQEGIPDWKLSEWKRREAKAPGGDSRQSAQKRKTSRNANVEFGTVGEEVRPPVAEQISISDAGRFVPLVPGTPGLSLKGRQTEEVHAPVAAEIKLDWLVVRVFRGADPETLCTIFQMLKECSLC